MSVSLFFITLGFLVILFLAIVVIRALLFTPVAQPMPPIADAPFDQGVVTEHLAMMIRIPTVSSRKADLVDRAQFSAFQELLGRLYPAVSGACARELIGESGILYCWKGKSADSPTVLMAHYDVVPASETDWLHQPFSGDVDNDGFLWGRGTIDTKITVCGILEAAETRIKNKFIPEHDVYFSFSGDEEIMGPSTPAIVDFLEKKGVRPSLVLDEGGAVVTNVFPGVSAPCAVIGITEKGIMDVEFTVKSAGGHASAPPVKHPVGILAAAILRIEAHPFPAKLTAGAAAMFDTLGRHSSLAFKMLFANLWCFFPVLKKICALTGGELNALVRTTCLFTVLEGSSAYNVMPSVAKAGANLRLLQGETTDSAFKRLRKIISDPAVEMRKVYGFDPSPSADLSGEAWAKVVSAVRQTWPEALVAPYLMVACTDSRHYCRISPTVLRFSAMELTKEERATMHARNERIPASKIPKTCAFYYRLMGQI